MQLASTERDPLIGQTLNGQFEILDRLGSGGMGAVYRARQLSVDREVAIKILRAELATNDSALTRFENESRIVARLRHPNTLRLYDCQRTADHRLFIVTELLHGSSLSAVMRTERSSLERILKILEQVCGSLAEAHQAGIIHRDIKPENVFLERVGTDEMVKLLDFGIAKLVGSDSLTGSGVIGTAHYMAPEQASGAQVDRRTDIYALGVMTYQLVTGRLPFTGETPLAVLYKHVHEPPPALDPRTPSLLVALIADMLAKDPRKRPATVEEVRHRLSEVAATSRGFVVSAPGAVLSEDALVAPTHLSGPTRVLPPSKHYGRLLAAGVLLALAFGFVFAMREETPPSAPLVAQPLPAPVAQLRTEPSGATVFGPDGKLVGMTPLALDLVHAGTYRVAYEGHLPKTVDLDPSRDGGRVVQVELEKVPPPAAPPPPPAQPKKRPPIKKQEKREVVHDKPVDVSWD